MAFLFVFFSWEFILFIYLLGISLPFHIVYIAVFWAVENT